MLQELLHPELPPGAHAVGARVEVLWPPETDTAEECVTWNEGVVASVHEDGSYYDVRYLDGDKETKVARKLIEAASVPASK